MVVGLFVIVVFVGFGQVVKVLLMMIFGLIMVIVGEGVLFNMFCFIMGLMDLQLGFSFIMFVMVMFVLFEVLFFVFNLVCFVQVLGGGGKIIDLCIICEEVKKIIFVIGWQLIQGFFIGVLLGVGVMIVLFFGYVVEWNFVIEEE